MLIKSELDISHIPTPSRELNLRCAILTLVKINIDIGARGYAI